MSQASTASNVVSDNVSASTVTGDSFTFTDTIVGVDGITPSGSVTWSVTGPGGTVLSCANVGSTTLAGSGGTATATCQINNALAGQYSAYAVYGGDTNYLTSTSNTDTPTVSQAQAVGTTSLKLEPQNPGPKAAGSTVNFQAHVLATAGNGPLTGTVTFYMNGVAVAGCKNLQLGSGVVHCSITFPKAGSFTVTAVYANDPNYAGSTDTSIQLITKAKS